MNTDPAIQEERDRIVRLVNELADIMIMYPLAYPRMRALKVCIRNPSLDLHEAVEIEYQAWQKDMQR